MPNTKPNWEGFDETAITFLTSQKKGTQATYKSLFKLAMAYPNWDDTKLGITLTGAQMLANKRADKAYTWERKIIDFKKWIKAQKTRNGDLYSDHAADVAVNTLRSFFDYYRESLKFSQNESRKLNTRARRKTQDYRLENEDIIKMGYVANLNEKYVVLMGKSLGLRVGDFTARTYGDYRSINLDQAPPIFMGEIQTEKEGVFAFPFIDSDALPIIKKILAVNQGKRDSDRVVAVKEEELTALLQRLALRGGINLGGKRLRFHCLRKYLIDRLANNMSESKWKQIVGKAISEDAYVSPYELKSGYLKTMQWTTINVNTNGIDMEKFGAVLEIMDDLAEIARLKREGKLLNLDDPAIRDKLKAAGFRVDSL
jgi:integrase